MHPHFVQFYKTDAALLFSNVTRYILEGLAGEENALVIAGGTHAANFRRALLDAGLDVQAAEAEGRVVFLDAQQTLSRFVNDRGPDWSKFEATIEAAVNSLAPGKGVRAYGEMVGILWQSGNYSAAIVLEDFWNRLLDAKGISLFCSYPIDVFDREFQICGVEALLCDHSHLLPSGNGDLNDALNRAIDEHFGAMGKDLRTRAAETVYAYWAEMPAAEATILWLRSHAPEHAEPVLQRAQKYYREARA